MALHRAVVDAWGEEVADTLFELVAPSGHELATRADIEMILEAMEAMDRRWDERFAASEARWQEQHTASEALWQERQATTDARLEAMEHRLTATFERGMREAITSQTRTLVLSQLTVVVVVAGLAFGFG